MWNCARTRSDFHSELAGYLSALANVVQGPAIVIPCEFGCGGARRIDQRRAEFGKLLTPLLKCIEVFREVGIGLPQSGDPHRAGNDLQAIIGQHSFGARQRIRLQEIIEQPGGRLDIADTRLGPAFEGLPYPARAEVNWCMLSVILRAAAPARSAASASGACRTVRRGSITNTIPLSQGLRGSAFDRVKPPGMGSHRSSRQIQCDHLPNLGTEKRSFEAGALFPRRFS